MEEILMKKMNFAALSLILLLYTGSAFAQHGHAGGAMGSGAMSAGAAHSSMGSSNGSSPHGSTSTTGSSQKPTVNDILSKNPAIGDKITSLTGDTAGAADACTGFKNLGQCIAAAHVAKNLVGGNFYCLRQAMTGTVAPSETTCSTTGTMSLGKAIQTLYPQANSTTESKKGQNQANQDLKGSSVKS
jgi:hypothetical protein